MRSVALVVSALLLACSSDDPIGQSAGLSAGGSPAASGGSPSAGSGGKAGDAVAMPTAGAAGQPGGAGGSVAGGSPGVGGSTAGAGGQPSGGQGGQPVAGGAAGMGGSSSTPAELGCVYQSECIDGRDAYKCPGDTLPAGCVEYYAGAGSKPIACCGEPKPTACKASNVAGSTRATATVIDGDITVALQPGAVAWLANPSESGSRKTPTVAGVFAATHPVAAGPVEVCFGYSCSDGSDGVGSCTVGQEAKADGLSLCCLASDFGSTGALPKASLVCPNDGSRTMFARFTSSASACVDVVEISVSSFL